MNKFLDYDKVVILHALIQCVIYNHPNEVLEEVVEQYLEGSTEMLMGCDCEDCE